MNRRPDAPDPLSPQERDLAERLLRLGPHDGPSPALDAAILGAARAAVGQPPQAAAAPSAAAPEAMPSEAPALRATANTAAAPRIQPRKRRWPAWVGVAASLTLAVGVAWQLRPVDPAPSALSEEQAAPAAAPPPQAEVAADAAADAAAGLAAPAQPQGAATRTPELPVAAEAKRAAADPAAPAPPMQAAPAEPAAPAPRMATPAPRVQPPHRAVENRAAPRSAGVAPPPMPAIEPAPTPAVESPAPAAAPAMAPPPPPPAPQGYSATPPAAAPADARQRQQGQPAAAAAAGNVAPIGDRDGLSRREARRPVAAPPAETAAKATVAAEVQRSAPPQQNAADTSLDRVEVTGSRIAPQRANALPPEQWLERIRQYRDDGLLDLARQDLREFRRVHPHARIPKDLRPLLE